MLLNQSGTHRRPTDIIAALSRATPLVPVPGGSVALAQTQSGAAELPIERATRRCCPAFAHCPPVSDIPRLFLAYGTARRLLLFPARMLPACGPLEPCRRCPIPAVRTSSPGWVVHRQGHCMLRLPLAGVLSCCSVAFVCHTFDGRVDVRFARRP